MTALETAVKIAWEAWGQYAGHNVCTGCGEMRYCRARRRRQWLCLDCFDQR